jgi:hypothetical protein
MTEKAAAKPVPDAELAKNMATIKRGVEARVGEIKRDLAHWLDDITTPADHTPVSIALLETAIDRHLDIHDEADARDLIERNLRRAVQRRRGHPAMSATRDDKYRCITECETPFGYWWRYTHAYGALFDQDDRHGFWR